VCESVLYTLYTPYYVSATHVAIFSKVHYKEYIYQNITDVNGTNAYLSVTWVLSMISFQEGEQQVLSRCL
jgi:uncharacterized membrane protein YiaA